MKLVNFLNFVIITLTMLGCASTSPKRNPAVNDFLTIKETRQITFIGNNLRPRFNDIGDKVIFYSSDRPEHKGAQIYEYDSRKNTLRRVTYSDGDAFDPDYINNREILYSSSTDEIKERLLQKSLDDLKKDSELYMSDLYGTQIVRATHRSGYDAEGIFLQKLGKNSIIYTSHFDGRSGIFALELPKMSVRLIAARTHMSYESPSLSPEKDKLAWIQTDLNTQKKMLVLYDLNERKSLILRTGEGDYADLFFAPNPPLRLFYSIVREDKQPRYIESLNIETDCTQVVFKGIDELSHPVISPLSPEKIGFSRKFADSKQIYITRLPDDLGPCLPQPETDTIKE